MSPFFTFNVPLEEQRFKFWRISTFFSLLTRTINHSEKKKESFQTPVALKLAATGLYQKCSMSTFEIGKLKISIVIAYLHSCIVWKFQEFIVKLFLKCSLPLVLPIFQTPISDLQPSNQFNTQVYRFITATHLSMDNQNSARWQSLSLTTWVPTPDQTTPFFLVESNI